MGLWIPLVLIGGTALALLLGLFARGKLGRRSYSAEDRAESPTPAGQEPDFSGYPCGHDKPDGPSIVEVYGVKIAVEAAPVCPDCVEEYLNRYSTRCASCRQPILPGMPVGQAWKGSPFPHTHMTFECTESGGLYCGRWGQGRLVTLHELDPAQFPPGTPNVMTHVYRSGKPTVIKS
jgi:hypothetical protein